MNTEFLIHSRSHLLVIGSGQSYDSHCFYNKPDYAFPSTTLMTAGASDLPRGGLGWVAAVVTRPEGAGTMVINM